MIFTSSMDGRKCLLVSENDAPDVIVVITDSNGMLPINLETETLVLSVFPSDAMDAPFLSRTTLVGREGANEWYCEHVGYRPDSEEHTDIEDLIDRVGAHMLLRAQDDIALNASA
ncbi:hypothetical protein [Azonexus hydrophilus]|uniref:Uncharacterized protein n=1 Tax=Azonexus hydrophilus TaxID=418702 RepID=A0ABZ2XN60_9RHOO